jgi:hypothetical protein
MTTVRAQHEVHRLRGAVAQPGGGFQVACSCGWHSATYAEAGEMLVAWRMHHAEPDRRKSGR